MPTQGPRKAHPWALQVRGTRGIGRAPAAVARALRLRVLAPVGTDGTSQ
jgi:hypothetical protein